MLQPGSQIGRYEIQRRLGRGGMGAVYVAHDPVLGRMVAIKVFAGELDMPDARERFVREARSAAALTHANIVTVYDFGELPSEPYIVMEYVQGDTLAQVIRRKAQIPLTDKLRWMEELCAGVGYAHGNSVLHRDIKPANLMIDRSGRLRILDFGIARLMGTASTTTAVIGTPGYMAPEQIEGSAVDQRADVFSIGAVLYELLTYTEAFPGKTAPAITHRIMTADPAPIRSVAPDVTPALAAVVEQALRKNPADRPENAETLRRAISACRRQSELAGGDATASAGHSPTDAPTLVIPRTPVAADPAGAGPAESPGLQTPAPEGRRTDREALARRRTAQIEAALDLARTQFAAGDLSEATEACQQALTLDETHPAALELEREIEAARAARHVGGVASLMDPGTLLAPPRPTGPPASVAALPGSLDASPQAGFPSLPPDAASDVQWDATVIAPPRRTPSPTAPSVSAEMPGTPETVSVRAKAERGSPTARARDKWLALKARVQALPPRTRTVAAGLSAAAAIGAVAGLALALAGGSSTGALVIEAVPWAMVTAVENADGERHTLPADASTPLLLHLPAGRYEVTVAGPPPASDPRTIVVEVADGTVTAPPAQLFQALTPEEYFEPYLSGLVASVDLPQ